MKKNIPDILIRLAGLTVMALIYIGLCIFLGNMRGYLNNGDSDNTQCIITASKKSVSESNTSSSNDSSYLHIIIIALLPCGAVWVKSKIRSIHTDKHKKNEIMIYRQVQKSQHDQVLAMYNKELSELMKEIERLRDKYDESNRKLLVLRESMIEDYNRADRAIKQSMRNIYSDMNYDLNVLIISENKLKRSFLYRLKNTLLNSKYFSGDRKISEEQPIQSDTRKKNGVPHQPLDYSIILANK